MATVAVKSPMTIQGITKVDKSSMKGQTLNRATHSTGKLMGTAPNTNGNITAVRSVLLDNFYLWSTLLNVLPHVGTKCFTYPLLSRVSFNNFP